MKAVFAYSKSCVVALVRYRHEMFNNLFWDDAVVPFLSVSAPHLEYWSWTNPFPAVSFGKRGLHFQTWVSLFR